MVLFSVKAGREPVAGMTAQEALPERREADGSAREQLRVATWRRAG